MRQLIALCALLLLPAVVQAGSPGSAGASAPFFVVGLGAGAQRPQTSAGAFHAAGRIELHLRGRLGGPLSLGVTLGHVRGGDDLGVFTLRTHRVDFGGWLELSSAAAIAALVRLGGGASLGASRWLADEAGAKVPSGHRSWAGFAESRVGLRLRFSEVLQLDLLFGLQLRELRIEPLLGVSFAYGIGP